MSEALAEAQKALYLSNPNPRVVYATSQQMFSVIVELGDIRNGKMVQIDEWSGFRGPDFGSPLYSVFEWENKCSEKFQSVLPGVVEAGHYLRPIQ